MEVPVLRKLEAERVELVTCSDMSLLRVTTSFVESAGLAFGLGEDETLALTLAVEEVFVYLCKTIPHHDVIRIDVTGKGFQVEVDFVFSQHELDLRAFNIVCMPDPTQLDDSCDETGMIIASRMVDSFNLDCGGSKLKLGLVKEKYYPAIDHLPIAEVQFSGEFKIQEANPAQVKELVRLASVGYDPISLPESYRYPGKVVDMVIRGNYYAAVAIDRKGLVGGGITWRWESDRLVTFRGPFLAPNCYNRDLSTRLVNFLLQKVARTNAIGVMSSWPSADLPVELFEKLGSQTLFHDGRQTEVNAYFRHLNEDYGNVVVVHPTISEFVRDSYSDLVLARHVENLQDTGESRFACSVISTKILRTSGRVFLRPVICGLDAVTNLKAHVELLLNDGIPNIFFEMDLGNHEIGMYSPALLECSFQPRFLIPHGGAGDIVIFQYIPGGSH